MKSISNWSILGYLIGAVLAIGSYWRYAVTYNVMANVILGVGLGVVIIGLSWLYNKQQEQGRILNALEEYLADAAKELSGRK